MSASPRIERHVVRALLGASRLPSLGPVTADGDASVRLAATAEDLLAGRELRSDVPLTTLLRWTAERRDVLFHGSAREDIQILEPIRLSRDATPFGDQQAVFASSDPVWAIYFATLRRGAGLRSMRNASIGLPGALYPRWYYFSHNQGAEPADRFGDGWLYVLPRAGFELERLTWGVLDTAQWASLAAVTPIARVHVGAADFPFARHVFPHRPTERVTRTIARGVMLGWRAGR